MGQLDRSQAAKQGLLVGSQEEIFGVIVSDLCAYLLKLAIVEEDRVFITHFTQHFEQDRLTPIKVNGTKERYVYIPAAIIEQLWLKCQLNWNIKMVERLSQAFSLKLLPHIAAHFLKSSLPHAYQFIHFDDRFGFCLHIGELRLKARVVDSLIDILGERDICLPVIDKRAGDVLFYLVSTKGGNAVATEELSIAQIAGFGRSRESMRSLTLYVKGGLSDPERRIMCLVPDDAEPYINNLLFPYYVPGLPKSSAGEREVKRAKCLSVDAKLKLLQTIFHQAASGSSGISRNYLPIDSKQGQQRVYVMRNDPLIGADGDDSSLRLLDLLLVIPNPHGSLRVLNFLVESDQGRKGRELNASILIDKLTTLAPNGWTIDGAAQNLSNKEIGCLFQSLEFFFRNYRGQHDGEYGPSIVVFPNNFIMANEPALALIRLIRESIHKLAQEDVALMTLERELPMKGVSATKVRACGFAGPA